MKTQHIKEIKKVPITTYKEVEYIQKYYISDDGLKKGTNEHEIKKYEKSLIDDKIFNITPLEQFPDSISEYYYHCGFAFRIKDEETRKLFNKKYLENYSGGLHGIDIYNRWFTYYTSDGGDYKDDVYFIFFDDLIEDINKIAFIIERFKNE